MTPTVVHRPRSVATALDRALGDPLDDRRAGSFRASVEADREGRFPRELCAEALDWGLAEHLVPVECGGRLESVEECFALARVLARRDLTAAVALGANLLAGFPVWLRGTPAQKRTVAHLLRSGEFLSFALSEAEHGADVLASEVTARRVADGWEVDGTKWLINNAGHAAAATVAARTGDGVRGLTLLLLARAPGDGGRWTTLPKVSTHGLRGSALGGMTYTGLRARDSDVVGRPGQGLEILLHTLQLTRVLVAGFALGALDTSLAATVAFARSRRLYGAPVVELEPVARRLVDAAADLLVGETVARGACRAAQQCLDQLPLTSASVKHLVPQLALDGIESLSVVLGARSYLAEGHWSGIVEKMRRDVAVTALFDGSSPVVLSAVVDQLPALASARAEGDVDELPPGMFSTPASGPTRLSEVDFELATGSDAVHRGLRAAAEALRHESPDVVHARHLRELIARCEAETAELDAEVTRHAGDADWRRSGAALDGAARYTSLHAAGACCWRWLAERAETTDPFVTSGAWLVMCLRRLVRPSGPAPAPLDDVDRALLSRLPGAPSQDLPDQEME